MSFGAANKNKNKQNQNKTNNNNNKQQKTNMKRHKHDNQYCLGYLCLREENRNSRDRQYNDLKKKEAERGES